MKYLPLSEFDTVTSALNFNTPDCNVTGGCDLYTTKTTGSDKKLYKTIDRDLSSHQEELLRLGASLSPPETDAIISSSPNLAMINHTSAFGPLSDLSSRKTFAHLIAILNASHPHYDFSNILRPTDFRCEKNLRRVMNEVTSLLQSVRPSCDPNSLIPITPAWGTQCWSLIDKEMRLEECTVFSYQPDIDPFEEDDHPLYSAHYFFFNRTLKRVAYLYVRIVPVMSSQSPAMPSHMASLNAYRRSSAVCGVSGTDPGLQWANSATKRLSKWNIPSVALRNIDDDDDDDVDLDPVIEDGEDDHEGFVWNRGEDGDLVPFSDDDDVDDSFDNDDDDDVLDMEMDYPPFPINYTMTGPVQS
ncbi:RNA polymerase III-inhibiting protein maf1 [Ceratocystis pirilliformis]|uniref:Repressor of RNA polymerase III transcription MAF1 n=1 Tax=Ceratocystis pirilliformis TaxID=259994 RepID=A0ABR3YSK5_9PEZI